MHKRLRIDRFESNTAFYLRTLIGADFVWNLRNREDSQKKTITKNGAK